MEVTFTRCDKTEPIAYAPSAIASRTELYNNTAEKELLATVWAIKHYRPLYGTKFTIMTLIKSLI